MAFLSLPSRFPVGWTLILAANLSLAACAGAIHTPYSAGERAARLANDRCQQVYGARPFAADDYEAEFIGNRWTWGGEGSQPVDGFSAAVSFDADGGRPQVVVDRGENQGNPDGF